MKPRRLELRSFRPAHVFLFIVALAGVATTGRGDLGVAGEGDSALNWVSYYEHTPSSFQAADNYTLGYLLNPEDPTVYSRPAIVTTTFFYGDCGSATIFKRSTQSIEAGSIGSFSSFEGQSLGYGCVHIGSSAPIVPLNAHIHDSGPLGLGHYPIEMHMDFVPVDWSA